MVLTLAMSFAVTSSITWWFLSPLIAENMPRIMRTSLLAHAICVMVGRIDTLGAGDGEDGAVRPMLVDLLDGPVCGSSALST